jgi:hypothetical protein
MIVHDENGLRPDWNWTPPHHPTFAGLRDIWMGNFIATGSTMFRRATLSDPPGWYDSFFPITDWPLHLLNAEHGSIGYINEAMGVYRYHDGGLYSALSQDRKLDETFRLFNRLNEVFEYRHDRLARQGIFEYFTGWAEEYAGKGDFLRASRCLSRAWRGAPGNRAAGYRKLLRLWLRIHVPFLRARRGDERQLA